MIFQVVEWSDVKALYEHVAFAAAPKIDTAVQPVRPLLGGRLRGLASRLPPEMVVPLGEAIRLQLAVFRGCWRCVQGGLSLLAARRRRALRASQANAKVHLLSVAKPGDVLCSLGAPWSAHYGRMIGRLKTQGGMRFAFLLHDLISVYRPEFHMSGQAEAFATYMREGLPLADKVFTTSINTAKDIVRWAEQRLLAALSLRMTVSRESEEESNHRSFDSHRPPTRTMVAQDDRS